MLHQEALKYTKLIDFQRGSPSAYQTAWQRKILHLITAHMEPQLTHYTDEELAQLASKYDRPAKFKKDYPSAYTIARNRGIWEKISTHMKRRKRKWLKEEVAELIKKYNTIKDFAEHQSGAYSAAKKGGYLREISTHMTILWEEKWNEETLTELCLNYTKKSKLQKDFPGARLAADRLGIWDKISAHMEKGNRTSGPELELLNTLKVYFPHLKKKMFQITVLDKPLIHAFELDIFDPKAKRGIEYDGTHWHSEEKLIEMKTKIGWSREDAINYHQIKDDALWDCHSVKVIHVTEKDWKADKEACVQRCLTFLKTGGCI